MNIFLADCAIPERDERDRRNAQRNFSLDWKLFMPGANPRSNEESQGAKSRQLSLNFPLGAFLFVAHLKRISSLLDSSAGDLCVANKV